MAVGAKGVPPLYIKMGMVLNKNPRRDPGIGSRFPAF